MKLDKEFKEAAEKQIDLCNKEMNYHKELFIEIAKKKEVIIDLIDYAIEKKKEAIDEDNSVFGID